MHFLKHIYVIDIFVLKAIRRKHESLWHKTSLPVHFDMHSESCMAVKRPLVKANLGYCKIKSQIEMVMRNNFKIVDTLLGSYNQITLPKYDTPLTLASVMNTYFH